MKKVVAGLGPLILLVEDEDIIAAPLQEKLESEGFRVVRARNGKEGLEEAKARRPDAIVLDVIMPVMDGMTMFDELKKEPWGGSIPVLFLTNDADMEKMKTSFQKDACAYALKSDWKLEEVLGLVRDVLKKKLA